VTVDVTGIVVVVVGPVGVVVVGVVGVVDPVGVVGVVGAVGVVAVVPDDGAEPVPATVSVAVGVEVPCCGAALAITNTGVCDPAVPEGAVPTTWAPPLPEAPPAAGVVPPAGGAEAVVGGVWRPECESERGALAGLGDWALNTVCAVGPATVTPATTDSAAATPANEAMNRLRGR
jgi:hypothetical protein